jgi:hypothetical protein
MALQRILSSRLPSFDHPIDTLYSAKTFIPFTAGILSINFDLIVWCESPDMTQTLVKEFSPVMGYD